METKRKVKPNLLSWQCLHVFFFHHKNNMFSGLRSCLLCYFSLKTIHYFLNICIIFDACCAHLRTPANTASRLSKRLAVQSISRFLYAFSFVWCFSYAKERTARMIWTLTKFCCFFAAIVDKSSSQFPMQFSKILLHH